MRIFTRFGLSLALLLSSASFLRAAPTTAPADARPIAGEEAHATDFLRFVDKGATGGRLETADVAYRNADGVTVHLVAAVHIGEHDYFEGLNQSFKLRDAVLYEMVKGKDQPLPEPGGPNQSHSAVSQFQRYLKDALNLEFQLDVVDYTAPNFIHADLDAETFQKMQDERGESMTMLDATLKNGKKDIAIFYGAAHMPDLSKRLTDMGFQPIATEWRMAWDLTIRNDEPSAVENILIELIRGMRELDK